MAEPESVAVPEPEKKRKLPIWMIVGAAVLLLGGGGGFLGLKYFRGSAPKTAEAQGSPVTRVKSIMNLESFLVNLADLDSTRFVKVTFRLGLDEAKVGEEYAADPVILAATRDKIISLLSTKTAEEILTPEGKDRLRKEICDRVNPILPKGKITEVFILDFVVQL